MVRQYGRKQRRQLQLACYQLFRQTLIQCLLELAGLSLRVQLPQSLKRRGHLTGGLSASWPHLPQQRQRVVVQVLPAVNGAWVDAVVETQPLASNDVSLMSNVSCLLRWETNLQGHPSVDATVDLAQRMELESEPVYSCQCHQKSFRRGMSRNHHGQE